MDFVVGFIIGYFLNKFSIWLSNIAQPKIPEHYSEEDWDWIS
jgi:hypothetical protein